MPLYRKATKIMLREQDNLLSTFALFIGAELKQKTAVTPQKVYDGSQIGFTNSMPQNKVNCQTPEEQIA